jgi:hypothetical protein
MKRVICTQNEQKLRMKNLVYRNNQKNSVKRGGGYGEKYDFCPDLFKIEII